MRIECYGATRKQDGHNTNEDAFLIGRASIPFAALCDGTGNAEKVAKKVLTLFQRMFNEARLDPANEEIYALQKEKYEQRKEIAQYHRQQTELLREIARLKASLEKKSTVPVKGGVTRE